MKIKRNKLKERKELFEALRLKLMVWQVVYYDGVETWTLSGLYPTIGASTICAIATHNLL